MIKLRHLLLESYTEQTAPEELKKAFGVVHNQQRWDGPESMFDSTSNPNVNFGTGIWLNALEHGGDLIHRSSYAGTNADFGGGGSWYGKSATLEKAERLLFSFKNKPGWMTAKDDVFQQIQHNFDYYSKHGKFSGTWEEFYSAVKDAGERYSNEYEKLKPVTEVQLLGRDIAICIGRFQFEEAVPKLKRLVQLLKGKDWEANYWKPLT